MREHFDRSIADITYEGRRLLGLALKWETPSLVTDADGSTYFEEFARASTDRSLSQRATFPLGVMHPWSPGARPSQSPIPVGAVTFHRSKEGLPFEATVANTAAGNDALELVNLGALHDVSVRFAGLRSTRRPSPRGTVHRREEIALVELSLAPPGMGQHEGAEVMAVRSVPLDIAQQAGTPRLEQLRRRRALLG